MERKKEGRTFVGPEAATPVVNAPNMTCNPTAPLMKNPCFLAVKTTALSVPVRKHDHKRPGHKTHLDFETCLSRS